MSEERGPRTGALLTALVAIVCLVSVTLTSASHGAPGSAPSHETALRVTGRARGLYPGGKVAMRVIVRNRLASDVELVRVRGRAVTGPAGCPPGLVRVKPFEGSQLVPANGRVRIRMTVRLARTATDACQGVRFRIRFQAKGALT